MAGELRPPIIVLGNTRSGTTVVQKVMATHPDVVAWYEPRTLWLYADPGRSHDEFDESDATDKVRRYIRSQFLRYQKQHGDRIVLEKTPANIFKVAYVRAIFPEATYLYIVREPFAVISSIERKWQSNLTTKGVLRRLGSTPITQLHHYAGRFLRDLVTRRVLGRRYLKIWGPRYRGIEEDLETTDLLTVIARQWAEGSRKAEEALSRFGEGDVLRLRYEDFCTNPIPDLERICAHCGLEMTDGMVQAANEWVKADRMDKWRRFDPRDLARILPEIYDEMRRHGYEVPEEVQRVMRQPDTLTRIDPALTTGA